MAADVVTKAQIDGDMLTFTPVAGASGTGYASFTFKVNDGTDDSTSAYTMTIDVAASPTVSIAAPTGATDGFLYEFEAATEDLQYRWVADPRRPDGRRTDRGRVGGGDRRRRLRCRRHGYRDVRCGRVGGGLHADHRRRP